MKEKIKKYWWIFGIIILFGIFAGKNNPGNQNNSDDSGMCLMHKITLEEAIEISKGTGVAPTQETVDEINKKRPLCRDVCQEQIKYSEENTDWWAEDDLRKICEEIGLPLPVK